MGKSLSSHVEPPKSRPLRVTQGSTSSAHLILRLLIVAVLIQSTLANKVGSVKVKTGNHGIWRNKYLHGWGERLQWYDNKENYDKRSQRQYARTVTGLHSMHARPKLTKRIIGELFLNNATMQTETGDGRVIDVTDYDGKRVRFKFTTRRSCHNSQCPAPQECKHGQECAREDCSDSETDHCSICGDDWVTEASSWRNYMLGVNSHGRRLVSLTGKSHRISSLLAKLKELCCEDED